MRNISIGICSLFLLYGCGGGQDTSPSTPTATTNSYHSSSVSSSVSSTPSVYVEATLNKSKVMVGDSVTLTWNSSNALSCSVTGFTPSAIDTSGHITFSPSKGGKFTYTVQCLNATSSAKADVNLVVPLPVLRSDYENRDTAAKILGPQLVSPFINGSGEWVNNGFAFADFFNEGEYSLVTVSVKFSKNVTPPDLPGVVKFWKKIGNVWVDKTNLILKDQTGCITAAKAMIVDINGDRKPDVVFACNGYDAAPFPGEKQRALVSQPDGTYSNVIIADDNSFCDGGTAADFNGDGYADIIYADHLFHKHPFYLVNNRNGTFTENNSKLPASVMVAYKTIYALQLLDVNEDGKLDLWVGGAYNNITNSTGNWYPTIYYSDINNNFSEKTKLTLPINSMQSYNIPGTLDVLYNAGIIYMLWDGDNYNSLVIHSVEVKTGKESLIYTHSGQYQYPSGRNLMTFFPWMIIYNNQVMSSDISFGVSLGL